MQRFIKHIVHPQQHHHQSPQQLKLKDKYEIGEILGEGHYGTVRACRSKQNPQSKYAVKTIRKAFVSKSEYLRAEVSIVTKLKHPNIIRVVDVLEDADFLHIVTELCTGGELFNRIVERKMFSEWSAALVLKQILDAVDYCHSQDPPIVHRDLKPENFMFKDHTDTSLKVIDFGLSKQTNSMHTRVGTPYYIAPEVLRRDYTSKCDLWSVGVIAYIMLCGYPPFYGESDKDIFRRIAAGKFHFPHREWGHVSLEAKEFVKSLLRVKPSERPTAREAIQHPFIKKYCTNKTRSAAAAVVRQEPRPSRPAALPRPYSDRQVDRHDDSQRGKCVKFTRLTVEILARADRRSREQLKEISSTVDKLQATIGTTGEPTTDNYQEFLKATMQRNFYLREENMKLAFDFLDVDRTGYVTYYNLIQLTGSKRHAVDLMREADPLRENLDVKKARISFETYKDMLKSSY